MADPAPHNQSTRTLIILPGDQLDPTSAVLEDVDPACDCIWMAEVRDEAEVVWSHKARIAMFLSAMRHHRDALRDRGWRVEYAQLDDPDTHHTLADQLRGDIRRLRPARIRLARPGNYRLLEASRGVAKEYGTPVDEPDEGHFLSTPVEFHEYAAGRKTLRMEGFYHQMRRKENVLMDGEKPAGEQWNFDDQNRQHFGHNGPQDLPLPPGFPPDKTTREVLRIVHELFPDHPGSLKHFDWPVTPDDARICLEDFIEHRLPSFGTWQDAMWTDQPFLWHSLLSPALNLKLLHPRQVIAAAEDAWNSGQAPLPSVEGFIRQVLGWREYIRGIYWEHMPGYLQNNALQADASLPGFYWTADTEAACLRACIFQTLAYGYAHHIQRLMVTGLFALLLGVEPRQVHRWYLAVYVDAVEWVESPNTIGMSQYADGGLLASKPYAASGNYIHRMSNYCEGCRYRYNQATGDDACPFTTLYWDFLARHEQRFRNHPRMALAIRNLQKKDRATRRAIRSKANSLREMLC